MPASSQPSSCGLISTSMNFFTPRRMPSCSCVNSMGASVVSAGLALRRIEIRGNDLNRLVARNHRHDLEGRAGLAPVQGPLLEESQIVAAHKLETAGEVGLDPAVDVFQPLRQQAPLVAHALVDRYHVVVAEPLD